MVQPAFDHHHAINPATGLGTLETRLRVRGFSFASERESWQKNAPFQTMSKAQEAQLLDLLKRVLPKATHDPKLAGKIYQAVETELKAKARVVAFEKLGLKRHYPMPEPIKLLRPMAKR